MTCPIPCPWKVAVLKFIGLRTHTSNKKALDREMMVK
jgi:hypothetical protein